MNLVLIHPYIKVREKTIYLTEPLGLASLATYAKHVFGKDINVTVLDLYSREAAKPKFKDGFYIKGTSEPSSIKKLIAEHEPDLIGITCCFTGYFEEALDVASIAKESFPDVPIMMGGAHATLEADTVLKQNPFVDLIIRNEGEITLVEIIKALMSNESIADIIGLSYRNESGQIIHNDNRPLIEDLDTLPIPDRKYLDMHHYIWSNVKFFNFSRKKPIATVMTSRGCPYTCVFCCTKNMWGRKWRPHCLARAFEEIEMLIKVYRVKEIVILDDQFIMNKERITEFCEYFIKKNYDVAFSNIAGLSAWLADDDELLKLMRKAGFYKITLPVESGNAETLKFIQKPIDLKKVKKLVRKANRLGYWTGAFFIIGFPYETEEQIRETIDFAYSSELDFAHFFVAQPYVGAELYEVYKQEGLLGEKEISGTFIFKGWYDTLHMTAKHLNEIQAQASGGWVKHKVVFYLNPKNFFTALLPKFRTVKDFKYSFGVFFMLVSTNIKNKVVNLFGSLINKLKPAK